MTVTPKVGLLASEIKQPVMLPTWAPTLFAIVLARVPWRVTRDSTLPPDSLPVNLMNDNDMANIVPPGLMLIDLLAAAVPAVSASASIAVNAASSSLL